jgi:hypothetical protein
VPKSLRSVDVACQLFENPATVLNALTQQGALLEFPEQKSSVDLDSADCRAAPPRHYR